MLHRRYMKSAIALMITLFFIMALTVSIGLGLKYVKEGAQSVNEEDFAFEARSVLQDFLTMLQKTPQVTAINSADTLSLFLSEASYIPINDKDMHVIIEIGSARDKINPIVLNTQAKRDNFKSFLASNGVNEEYLNILDDMMGGIKEDASYKTDIFDTHPNLFRNYIASDKELYEANRFYMQTYHDDSIKKIKTDELFYLNAETNASNYKMDLNRIKPVCWQVLLGCDEERAKWLSDNAGFYTSGNDLGLSEDENRSLSKFSQNVSYYEPYLAIKILILKKHHRAKISFEYNLESKKGSNFVFEV